MRDDDEPANAPSESGDQQHRNGASRSLQVRVHALQVRRHPEAGDTDRPGREQDAERVVPRVHRRQVDDGEADPQARVTVAARLEIEARDGDEQDGEVCLRQDPPEKGERRVGDDVEERPENHRREERLAPELALLVSLPVADHVSDRGCHQPDGRHDVVLSVEHDPEDGDGKPREHERPRFHRLLDRGRRQPQPAPH